MSVNVAMIVLALSRSAQVTIVEIAVFFVGFPLIVGGLILFAVIQARGEQRTYEETRRHTPLEPPHHLS
jgi:hypothetical protein